MVITPTIAIGLALLFIIVTALFAKRKGRNVILWGVTATFGLILTLIGLAFFGDLKKMTPEEVKTSKKREKIFCSIVIIFGALSIIGRYFL